MTTTSFTITLHSIGEILQGKIIEKELPDGSKVKLRMDNELERLRIKAEILPVENKQELPPAASLAPEVDDFPEMKASDLTCAICGSLFATRRKKGQHQRWCGRQRNQLPVATIPTSSPTNCCPTCLRMFTSPGRLAQHHRTSARCGTGIEVEGLAAKHKYETGSECCGADVHPGDPHPNGNRYCDACGEPCRWKAPPLPSDVRPLPVKVLTQQEKELLASVRGDDDTDL